ncbi:MAG: hypothetical protein JXR86_04965 [Spirochaetales bacterium]|nr:hypothetical protein [Spirochaetales bacterium]
MSPEGLAFAPVLLPLLGAAIVFLAKAFFRGRGAVIAEYTGVFTGLYLPWLALIFLFPVVINGSAVTGVIGHWNSGVGISYRFDGLAWMVNVLGYTLGGAAWLHSLSSGPKGPSFSAIFLIQTAALGAAIMTADLFNLFVSLEVLGISSYILVSSSEKPGAALASFSYLMVSSTAMVFFLLGLFGLYRITGSLSYEGIAAGSGHLEGNTLATAVISLSLLVGAIAIRVAVMPLYGWLPDAHALAPHAVSAVLSGVLIKTPLFALSRILILFPIGKEAGQLMSYAGAATALLAVIIALSQKDAKRLLAYHSISQIGYIVCTWGAAVAVGIGTKAGTLLMAAAFLHALFHAVFKGLLFLSIGSSVDAAGERDVYKLRGAVSILKRSGDKAAIAFFGFLVGALSISAIPPFNGFTSKTAMTYLLKYYGQSGTVLYWMLTVAGAGTAASFIKLSRIYWPGKDEAYRDLPDRKGALAVLPASVSILFLSLLCIAGGIFTPLIFRTVTALLSGSPLSMGEGFSFFSAGNLMKSLYTAGAGIFVFLLATGRRGGALLTKVRERPRSFQGLFVSYALAAAAMAGWLLYHAFL